MITWILIMVHVSGYALVVEEYNVRQTCADAALVIQDKASRSGTWRAFCTKGEK